jgi:hypothetical protein
MQIHQEQTAAEIQNMICSRIATYEALADKISNITGLNAYTVKTTVDNTTPLLCLILTLQVLHMLMY